jgi:hypothetical protein
MKQINEFTIRNNVSDNFINVYIFFYVNNIMNNLNGIVLELFIKDSKNKINNVLYGGEALDKFIEISFKDNSEKEKKIYKKKWDVSKVGNSVYFVSNKGDNKITHRFISDSWIDGGHSYLGHNVFT